LRVRVHVVTPGVTTVVGTHARDVSPVRRPGNTVKTNVCESLPRVAVRVTVTALLTAAMVTTAVPVTAPSGIDSEAGTEVRASLLANGTEIPPAGAGPDIVAVH